MAPTLIGPAQPRSRRRTPSTAPEPRPTFGVRTRSLRSYRFSSRLLGSGVSLALQPPQSGRGLPHTKRFAIPTPAHKSPPSFSPLSPARLFPVFMFSRLVLPPPRSPRAPREPLPRVVFEAGLPSTLTCNDRVPSLRSETRGRPSGPSLPWTAPLPGSVPKTPEHLQTRKIPAGLANPRAGSVPAG